MRNLKSMLAVAMVAALVCGCSKDDPSPTPTPNPRGIVEVSICRHLPT